MQLNSYRILSKSPEPPLFKAIKQNLKIKTFLGTSANAVKTQIWTALIANIAATEVVVRMESVHVRRDEGISASEWNPAELLEDRNARRQFVV